MSEAVQLALIASVAPMLTSLLTALILWLKIRQASVEAASTAVKAVDAAATVASMAVDAAEKTATIAAGKAVEATELAAKISESNALGISQIHTLVNSQRDALLAKVENLERIIMAQQQAAVEKDAELDRVKRVE